MAMSKRWSAGLLRTSSAQVPSENPDAELAGAKSVGGAAHGVWHELNDFHHVAYSGALVMKGWLEAMGQLDWRILYLMEIE